MDTSYSEDTKKTGLSNVEPAAEQVSPLVASLRAHLAKWYATRREERTKEMNDVHEGVEVSG